MANENEHEPAYEEGIKEAFGHGYLIAIANVVHISGDYRAAMQGLREGCITREEMRALGLSEFDTDVLNVLYDALAEEDADEGIPA